MKKSNKKSTVKSKSKKVKNPLKKYQGGGGVNIAPLTTSATPTTGFGSGNLGSSGFGSASLGGDSYLSTPSLAGSNTFNTLYGGSTPSFSSDNLTNVSDPSYGGLDSSLDTSLNAPRSLGDYYKDTQTAFGDKSNTADILKSEYKTTPLSKQDANLRKAKIAADTLSAIPFTNIVGEGMKSTKVDDPNKFYSRGVREKLERYNKKIKGAKTTSAGLSTTATALGTASGIAAATGIGAPVAIGLGLGALAAGIGSGISSGVAGGYSNKQEQFAAEYEENVENRKRDILRTDEQRKKNAAMNAQQYYNVPTAKTGGLMKYMEGGYTKVTGPSHENGGVPMDLDEDGVIDSELEGDEIIEELPEEGLVAMKQGGSVPKKYIWSDHLKTGGMSFAKKFEKLRKGGARPGDVEKLRIEQEIAAKRDPSKLYAKYGGMMKYKGGGIHIDPAKRGTFKAQASKMGMGVQEAAGKILSAPEGRYSPEMRRKANFAKNFAKRDGGMMDYMEEGGVPNKYKGFSKLPEGVQRKIDSDLAMKYGHGGMMHYMEEGGKLPKEVLESRLESHMSEGEAQDYLDSYKGGGLWANIHAKRKRIAAGSGEKMRKPGSEGAPTAKALRESKRDGGYLEYKKGGFKSPAWTRKEGQNPSGGLNAKGRASAKAEGSNLKAPVSSGTNPRRVSFAARFAGMKGPMKNEKGEPTRKALALKKWGFGSEEAARNFANRNKKSARYGGLMKYKNAGVVYGGLPPNNPLPPPPTQERVSRTGAGKFLAEYGAPMANVVGEAANIGMNLSQKYTPVAPVTARDVKAEQVFIDRAKDKRVGARESELVAAKRAIQQKIGSGQGQLNAARMISLRAQEEAAQNVYDINRQASATEQQLNQQARLEADMANQRKDLVTSESRRAESLREQSFENMRKKYIGSAASGLGNQLAQGMYTKEYINATLPDGVDPYELRPGAIADKQQEINPATGELYTLADARNEVLMQLQKERLAKAARKKGT